VRGAWIEITLTAWLSYPRKSHPVRGAWIEIKVSLLALLAC